MQQRQYEQSGSGRHPEPVASPTPDGNPEAVVPDAAAPSEPATTARRSPTWQLIVSAVLVTFVGAQFFAGWKFLNGQTYPVVGSAMFNGPPTPTSEDFLVPRIIGTAVSGERVEMDHHTFELEPFEWRAWIIDNLEIVTPDEADAAGAGLARAYTSETGTVLASFELWRVPALTDDFDRATLVLRVEL
jgi:hypothetical protein